MGMIYLELYTIDCDETSVFLTLLIRDKVSNSFAESQTFYVNFQFLYHFILFRVDN